MCQLVLENDFLELGLERTECCQDSWPTCLCYFVKFFVYFYSRFTGLSQTSPGVSQFRICTLQRSGFCFFACLYTALRAARILMSRPWWRWLCVTNLMLLWWWLLLYQRTNPSTQTRESSMLLKPSTGKSWRYLTVRNNDSACAFSFDTLGRLYEVRKPNSSSFTRNVLERCGAPLLVSVRCDQTAQRFARQSIIHRPRNLLSCGSRYPLS